MLNLKIASKILAQNTRATVVAQTLKNGTKVQYLRNGANGIRKVISKPDGSNFVSMFSNDGTVQSVKQTTKRGSISYLFGGTNYDKVVQVNPKIGGEFTLLGHRGKAKLGQLWSNLSGRWCADNKYIKGFKQALEYIRGRSDQYLRTFAKLNNK